MPTIFGHTLAALTLTKISKSKNEPKRLWALSILSGIIPDIDSIAFKFGISYGNIFGHRGFTHSIFFAILWSSLLTWVFFRKQQGQLKIFLFFIFVTLSHGLLDAFTNGGLGVGFFIPFNNERIFFAFRPIAVSPLSLSRFFQQSLYLLVNEMIWVGVPCILLLILFKGLKKTLGKKI